MVSNYTLTLLRQEPSATISGHPLTPAPAPSYRYDLQVRTHSNLPDRGETGGVCDRQSVLRQKVTTQPAGPYSQQSQYETPTPPILSPYASGYAALPQANMHGTTASPPPHILIGSQVMQQPSIPSQTKYPHPTGVCQPSTRGPSDYVAPPSAVPPVPQL